MSDYQDTQTNTGDSRLITINVVDTEGEPAPVTGYNLIYTIAAPTPVTKTNADGITVDGAQVTILLDAADTAALNKVYQHRLTADDGIIYQTVLSGRHLFLPSILSGSEDLTATIDLILFGAAAYMLNFSRAQNSGYLSLF